jgi:hypothetical protein
MHKHALHPKALYHQAAMIRILTQGLGLIATVKQCLASAAGQPTSLKPPYHSTWQHFLM